MCLASLVRASSLLLNNMRERPDHVKPEDPRTSMNQESADGGVFGKLNDILIAEAEIDKKARIKITIQLFKTLIEFPENSQKVSKRLLERLFRGISVSETLDSLGLQLLERATKIYAIQPIIIELLCNVKHEELERRDVSELCTQELQLLKDTEFGYLDVIMRFVGHLARMNAAVERIPFAEMVFAGAIVKSRLMAVNEVIVRNSDKGLEIIPKEFMMTSPQTFDCDDTALLAAQILHIYNLVCIEKPNNSLSLLLPAIAQVTRLYIIGEEALLQSVAEKLLAELAHRHSTIFMKLDAQFSLVTAERASLMAKIPPDYIVEHHPNVISQLVLTANSLPTFCNMASHPVAYKMLPLSDRRIHSLPFDLRLEFAIAATNNKLTATMFIDQYYHIIESLLGKSTLPSILGKQRQLRINLARHRQVPYNAPLIATEHLS